MCKIMYQGEERLYRRLHILEFDSDRKRMSVIVQFPDESIWQFLNFILSFFFLFFIFFKLKTYVGDCSIS